MFAMTPRAFNAACVANTVVDITTYTQVSDVLVEYGIQNQRKEATFVVASLCLEALRPVHVAELACTIARRLDRQAAACQLGSLAHTLMAQRSKVAAAHAVSNVHVAIDYAELSVSCIRFAAKDAPAVARAVLESSGQASAAAAAAAALLRLAQPAGSEHLAYLLHAVGHRSQLLAIVQDMCTFVQWQGKPHDSEEQQDFLYNMGAMLQIAELLPVRLAQWCAAVAAGQQAAEGELQEISSQPTAAPWLASELAAALQAAGAPDIGSVGRVRDAVAGEEKPADDEGEAYGVAAEQLVSGSGACGPGGLLDCAAFTVLWRWSGEACAKLVAELRVACGAEMDQMGSGGGEALPLAAAGAMGPMDVVSAIAAVREALGLESAVGELEEEEGVESEKEDEEEDVCQQEEHVVPPAWYETIVESIV